MKCKIHMGDAWETCPPEQGALRAQTNLRFSLAWLYLCFFVAVWSHC